MKKDKEFTAHCGLYCGDCILSIQTLFNVAEKLREQLDEIQFEKYAELRSKKNEEFNNYQIFKKILSALIEMRCRKTCINNGGNPNYMIRGCVRKKGIEGCWECPDLDC